MAEVYGSYIIIMYNILYICFFKEGSNVSSDDDDRLLFTKLKSVYSLKQNCI